MKTTSSWNLSWTRAMALQITTSNDLQMINLDIDMALSNHLSQPNESIRRLGIEIPMQKCLVILESEAYLSLENNFL